MFRQAKKQDRKTDHHHVYVILLEKDVAKLSKVKAENPTRNPELSCVYAGMTGLDPEERFQNHLEGMKKEWSKA